MKKSIFLTFVLAAGFAVTFLTSCGDDGAIANCIDSTGLDTGAHKITINSIPNLVPDIRDSLDISTNGSGQVVIYSHALTRPLVGTKDPSDCNKVTLDSVIFPLGDTLVIESTNALFASIGGKIKIFDLKAGGSGTITSTGVTTYLKVVSGKTNVSSPVNLTNLAGKNLELKGSFLKVP